MKRLISSVLVVSLALMLTSCLEIEKKRDRSEMLHVEEDIDMGERTIDISDGIIDDGNGFSYACDLDYDGKKEDISMSIAPDDEYEEILEVSVGGKNARLPLYGGSIEKVYSCDLVENDRTRDVAIITEEVSGDPRIRILSYSNELRAYEFKNEYEDSGVSDSQWLGYACSYYFKVNDDNTIMLEEQTNNTGMWSVYRKYELKNGVFEEIPYEKYKIISDFMKNRTDFDPNITEEERQMWQKGYIRAYVPYQNDSISVDEGEYIKPLYDNDKNRIYVEKETGEKGYIEIDYEGPFIGSEFNPMFFFLAG